ncbi:hypothetical protein HERIO_1088 [Hepatospora eriocheir]|uniref:Uncharacterized protein n=1 Tax=Hepatospora eriocheir TaxID=1081669 RepID=A0A1X0QBD0_9MICR|nr:hypothetical protein HERIO_1088 [Hepatospora eriocheir]
MEEYDYNILYVSGINNTGPDYFSRLCNLSDENSDDLLTRVKKWQKFLSEKELKLSKKIIKNGKSIYCDKDDRILIPEDKQLKLFMNCILTYAM